MRIISQWLLVQMTCSAICCRLSWKELQLAVKIVSINVILIRRGKTYLFCCSLKTRVDETQRIWKELQLAVKIVSINVILIRRGKTYLFCCSLKTRVDETQRISGNKEIGKRNTCTPKSFFYWKIIRNRNCDTVKVLFSVISIFMFRVSKCDTLSNCLLGL